MPAHKHTGETWVLRDAGKGYFNGNNVPTGNQSASSPWYNDAEWSTASSGGDQPHNNMQPYVTLYIWERTR